MAARSLLSNSTARLGPWTRTYGLTDYQIWTGYRIATRQLNLHHARRLDHNLCRKQPGCPGNEETLAHVFWDCPYAVALWEKLIGHWTGERPSRRRTHDFFDASARRRVVNIPAHRKVLLVIRFPEDGEAAAAHLAHSRNVVSNLAVGGSERRGLSGRDDGNRKYHDQLLDRLHPTT
uniref:RxLR effector candidate protein n=1 Tax=Hyaloperonospora arabidopsidis (strain Emoy2) TaxID=559515 RepID=M4C328_HYAAE